MPVLFVLLLQNYRSFGAFRLNKKHYTAFTEEEEFLFMAGFRLQVLQIEQELKVTNEHKATKEFNGKKMHVVYLYQGVDIVD